MCCQKVFNVRGNKRIIEYNGALGNISRVVKLKPGFLKPRLYGSSSVCGTEQLLVPANSGTLSYALAFQLAPCANPSSPSASRSPPWALWNCDRIALSWRTSLASEALAIID